MKILEISLITTRFPVSGNLWLYNRITGLIDSGHDIKIFALTPPSDKFPLHEDIKKYDLVRLVEYHGRPISKIETIKVIIKDAFKKPIAFLKTLIKSLNINKFGTRSLSLSAYFLLRTYSKYKHFDIIYGVTGPTSTKAIFLKELFPSAKFVAN